MKQDLLKKAQEYLYKLCTGISERCVGSRGNREAVDFFKKKTAAFGFRTESIEFDCMDWRDGGGSLTVGEEAFEVLVSPYSKEGKVRASLCAVSTYSELEACDMEGKILLLHGAIAKEQIMPKNFVFYNPEEHKQIIACIEKGKPSALVCATGRNPEQAGAVYPFPLFEDGDFHIPSVYMTEEEGGRLLPFAGKEAFFESRSQRIKAKGEQVIARKTEGTRKIVVTAHIDSKQGSPGAIDNAGGVVVLLLLMELLADYKGPFRIEIVPFNGEDYYKAPGQMCYLEKADFPSIHLAINLDGAGFAEGKTAYACYECPETIKGLVDEIFPEYPELFEGEPWYQSDHSIFIQQGRPALSITSKDFMKKLSAEITHTPEDKPEIVDCSKLVTAAEALCELIMKME